MTAKRITKPSFKPTDDERNLVEQMTACGIPQESQCLVIRDGIDDKTLRKHFRRELDTAATKANTKVAGTLFSKAMGGDTAAMIWWSKTRMGWKDSSALQVTAKIEHKNIIDMSRLDDEDLQTIERVLEHSIADRGSSGEDEEIP